MAKFINSIRIRYFRSIYDVKFKEISDTLTIFTGKNDVGKSNVLRALNLFFNNETDVYEEIAFERDFSQIRKKELRERIKTTQLIKIDIEFKSPSGYKSLPSTFTASRTFDRNNKGSDYSYSSNIKGKKATAAARRFLNSIQFTYIPAIKDNDTFIQLLQSLKAHLPPLGKEDLDRFNSRLESYGNELKEDFKAKLSLKPILSLPSTARELFSTLDFSIQDELLTTSLAQRGDGIRCRFIPSIMNYITQNSLNRHIWAIEEPENSLEFSKALELAQTLEKEYSNKAQIFVTSHSPAFVGSIEPESHKIIYYLEKEDGGKLSQEKIDRNLLQDEQKLELSQKLGYISLQKDLAECLHKKITQTEQTLKEIKELKENISNTSKSYILCVEGETDKIILENAWNKLHPTQPMPFFIHICYADTQIKSLLDRINLDSFIGKTFIGLWDFDSAYNQWNGLSKGWKKMQEDISLGLLNKKAASPLYALLIPVPSYRTDYASKVLGAESALSIELLFKDRLLSQYANTKHCLGGGSIKEMKNSKKVEFANKTNNFNAHDFEEFNKIFQIILDIEAGIYHD